MKTSSLLPILLAGAAFAAAQPQPPQNLRCEYLTNPEAVDAAPPRLSWQPLSTTRGNAQTAYQILVSKDPAVAAEVQHDYDLGMAAHVDRTPTMLMTHKGKQTPWSSWTDYGLFKSMVDLLLSR